MIKGKDRVLLALGDIHFLEDSFARGKESNQAGQPVLIGDGLSVKSEPEDFVRIPFRQISAVLVGSGTWKATDFSTPGVLEKALPMFKGKTVYRNHEMYVGNHVGVIGEAEWQGETVTSGGEKIPSGINAPFIIDSKIHPVLARELSSPYPPVRSVSISVSFEWEASHEFEDIWQFRDMLGEKIDGKEVCRVVTSITEISESSLVWEGADPYAKMLGNDGKVMLSAESWAKKRLGAETVKQSKQIDLEEMKHEKLLNLFGVESLEAAESVVEKYELVEKGAQSELKASFESLKAENAELKARIAESEAYALFGKAAKTARIEEAKRLYIASLGDSREPSNAMIADIESSSFDVLDEKIKLFGGKAESSFTRRCNDCGGVNVSLRSSVASNEPGDTDDNEIEL